ncbi:MAG: nucleotidyltransferase family protein [Pseudomonadales bacterium]|nr:nucleotidyltransferase family protein [Pseudomonadales bacterium]
MKKSAELRSYPLLLSILANPKAISDLTITQWNELIRLARVSDLLANLYASFERLNLLEAIPEKPLLHLRSAQTMTDKHEQTIVWEAVQISAALQPLNAPVVLLKGAAYLLQGLTASKGRVFHDVDVMVPKASIDAAEPAFKDAGWMGAKQDAYDQRYYREWMHELPPMSHYARCVTLDLHHTIIPPTAALKPDASKLFDAIVPVKSHPGLYTLSPVDMVLHSATHLFYDDEIGRGMRDLVDLHHLLTEFSARPDFWPKLLDRSLELDLDYPLACALKYCKELLQTDIPNDVFTKAKQKLRFPNWMMDKLFVYGLKPEHELCDNWPTSTARFVLYVRSHYLRMPLYLLVPHLLRKAFREETIEPIENPRPLG